MATEDKAEKTADEMWSEGFDRAAAEIVTEETEEEGTADAATAQDGEGEQVAEDVHDGGHPEAQEAGEDQGAEVKGQAEGSEPGVLAEGAAAWSLEDDDVYSDYHVLRRQGWPDRIIKQLSREELRESGSRVAKVQADIDRKLSEGSATEAGTKDGDGAAKADHPREMDPTVLELARPIAENLGLEDDGRSLVSLIERVSEGRTTKSEKLLGELATAHEDILQDIMRGKLAADVPQLEDDSVFQKVWTRMGRLAAAGEESESTGLARMSNLLRLAARLELPDMPSKSERERKVKVQAARNTGNPTVSTTRGTPTPLTENERMERLLEALEGGMSEEEALSRYSKPKAVHS